MARPFFRFTARRGLVALASWIVWPMLTIVIDYSVRLSVSTGRGCSIEGCNVPPGVLDTLLILGPPVYLTLRG